MMNEFHVPTFVPSKVCLACDGCCRFKDEDSVWRPKVGQEEISIHVEKKSLFDAILKKDVDPQGALKTIFKDGECQCVYFEAKDRTCRVYKQRPFDCRLYPFVLARRDNAFFLAVHINCPFVQLKYGTEDYINYLPKLLAFFDNEEIKDFLKNNPHVAGNYQEYEGELRFLQKLDV